MSLVLKASTPARRSRPRQTTKVVTVTAPRNRRVAPRRRAAPSSGPRNFLLSYSKTLNDPFEFCGVPLGYDCYLPTSQVTAYRRDSLIVNADGSFSLVFFPSAASMVQPSTVAKGVAHAGAFVSSANYSNIQANFKEGRCVSGGLRCFALFPETSAPGVLFGGTAPDLSTSEYQLLSTDNLASYPGTNIGIGTKGMSTTIRPYDNGSFEFFQNNVTGFASGAVPFMTSSYICGMGFPPGTVVWYEAILNLEAIAVTSVTSSAPPSDFLAAPTAASFFPTPGALFTAAQQYLSPPVILDGIDAAASLYMGNNMRAAGAVGRLASRLGNGSNRETGFVQRASRQNTVVIEEMKEDAMPSSSWSVLRR